MRKWYENMKCLDDSDRWNEKRKKSVPKFWSRLGGQPSFAGLKILDLGCGGGYLCLEMARARAEKVVGIDIDEDSISSAKRRLNKFPELSDRVEFFLREFRKI